MKLLGIVGSMRKEGNTAKLVETVLSAARENDSTLKVELVQLADLEIGPCQACYDVCAQTPYKCVVRDDFQKLLRKMEDADGLVIGSPLYFFVPSRLTALCERLTCLAYFHEVRGHRGPHLLDDRPCAFVATTAGNDPIDVFLYLHRFAVSMRMSPVLIKQYPYFGAVGRGDLAKDIEQARELGKLLSEAVKR